MISRHANKIKLSKFDPLEAPTDPTPVTLATVYNNPNNEHEQVQSNMLALFDDGSSGSMIKECRNSKTISQSLWD